MIRDSPPEKRKFLPMYERYEPVMQDSTAMRTAKECLRKYFYRIVLGLVPKIPSGKPYILEFGTAYHKFREVLEIELISLGIENHEDPRILMKAFEAIQAYAPKIPPESKQDVELYSPKRLMECCHVAYNYWLKEKKDKRFHVIKTEMPFNVNLPDGSLISGRVDQLVDWNGRIWDRDFKTTSKEESMFKRGIDPNDQGTRYIYGLSVLHGQPIGGVIFELMLNIKGKKPDIKPVILQKNKDQLIQWEAEQLLWNKILDACRESDMWPQSDCGTTGSYVSDSAGNCAWCDYRHICNASNQIGMKQVINTQYLVKPWRMEQTEQAAPQAIK